MRQAQFDDAPRELYPHQRRILETIGPWPTVAMFVQMRLGKSIMIIRWLRLKLARDSHVLIVAPVSTMPGWIEELELEGERGRMIDDEIRSSSVRKPPKIADGTWLVVNYESLRARPHILDFFWKAIVLDESTKIKNPQAQITKLLARKTRHIPYRAILSGLPVPESTIELYPQMNFLEPNFMGCKDFWQWRGRYFINPGGKKGFTWFPKHGTKAAIEKAVAPRTVALTREQAGMGDKKVYEKLFCSMVPEQRALYKQIETEFAFELEDRRTETIWVVQKLTWMARLAGGFTPTEPLTVLSGAKQALVLDLLQQQLKGDQVVIWFRFNAELAAVHSYLTKFDTGVGNVEFMTGATPVSERGEIQKRFASGKTRILLMQSKIGRYGLNLSAGSTSIYYSNGYSFEDRAQSEDRLIHLTKCQPLLYIDLITAGTVDEAVVTTLRRKSRMGGNFINSLLANRFSSRPARRVK